MLKKLSLIFSLTLLLSQIAIGQETWSLEKCIDYAKENSIAIKQAQLGVANAVLTEKGSKMARLPSLNASANGGAQFGRTIDPTTNSFASQTIGFNNLQLNTGVTIFAGGRIKNTIKQSQADVKVAELDGENAANTLFLNVAASYLNILMAEETYQNTLTRRKLSEQQLERTDKLISAGSLPKNDRLNILSQLAMDEQSVIQAKNSVDIGYLNLMNMLQIDPSEEFKIAKPAVEVNPADNPDLFQFETVYNAALGTQPNIRAAEMREKSAEIGVDIAKASLLPTISAFGGIDSRWSSIAKDFNNPSQFATRQNTIEGEVALDIPQFPDPIGIALTTEQEVPTDFPKLSYFDQLNENLGQNLGLSVQVPIYNNHRNRISIERAKLNVISSQLNAEQTKQQLKSDVQTAIANSKAALRTHEAAKSALIASEAAFDNADKRYQLGALSTFDYANARNNLDSARIEVIRTKYDYIFRLKIVDFYTGKELKF